MAIWEVCDKVYSLEDGKQLQSELSFDIYYLPCLTDSGKRKKKGSELEQIDCTPPEHILPGSKERPLVPLQPQNKDWKVSMNRHVLLMQRSRDIY